MCVYYNFCGHDVTTKQEKISPLRRLRMERGLTLAEVAAKANVDVSALSRMERGMQYSKKHAPKVLEYFGREAISLEDILCFNPEVGSGA